MKNRGLTTWKDTANPMTELRREFDRLFDDWTTPTRGLLAESQFVPACDVEETEEGYVLTLETAGVKKDAIKMEVVDNQITISGERQNKEKHKEGGRTYSERSYGRFERTFALPNGIDADKVEATYEDGILRVAIPKSAEARPREIKISEGSKVHGLNKAPKARDQPRDESQAAS